jgi:hypothetical protein
LLEALIAEDGPVATACVRWLVTGEPALFGGDVDITWPWACGVAD